MSVEICNCIDNLVRCDRNERAEVYSCLFDALNRNAILDISSVHLGRMTNVMVEDLEGGNEKRNLCALNLCSWLVSGNFIRSCNADTTQIQIKRRNVGKGVLRLLSCGKYDIVLMCLFVIAQQVQSDWIDSGCNAQCAVQVVHMVGSVELVTKLCKTKADSAKSTVDELACKLHYWSYKALTRLSELRVIRFDLLETAETTTLYSSAFASILKALNEKSAHFTSPLPSTAIDSSEEGLLLPLVQLEFLVNVPVGVGLVSCLQQVLSNTGLIEETVSGALKKSSVSEVVVQRCSQLWRLWVQIAAELLVPQALPAELAIVNGSAISISIEGQGGAEAAKNAFMDLLAPKNGVGVLTAPLQPILRRSRGEAARCYLTLAQCLVLVEDWHQPASVLKLLLRCLYHLLFTDTASICNSTTTGNTPHKKNTLNAIVSEEAIKRERDNLLTLKTAGEAVQVLCASIPRNHLRAVPVISISLGRLPSTACSSTSSSPRARKTTTSTATTASTTAPTDITTTTTATSGTTTTDPAGDGTTTTTEAAGTVFITPGKTTQHVAFETPASVSIAAVSLERASLDIIIRKLLDTTEMNTIYNSSLTLENNADTEEQTVLCFLVVVLSRVQQVCSGAVALSLMLSSLSPPLQDVSNNTSSLAADTHSSSSAAGVSKLHNLTDSMHGGKNAVRVKNHHHLLSKGLFASPSKISIKPPVPTNLINNIATNTNPSSNDATSESTEEPLTCAELLSHMQHLHTSFTSIAHADNIHTNIASTHPILYNKLVSSLDLTSQLHTACSKLTTSWQLCTLSLAQALFDDLVLTEGSHHREGDDLMHSAPRYQSTQLDSFSLLFSAPTQSSQVYLHSQRYHNTNTLNNNNKRSQQKLSNTSNTSPSQQNRARAPLPGSYPHIESPQHAGASPRLQVVLCSAHPPAVQAAVDLCSVFVNVWVDVWLSTALGRQQHKQRAVFVESFWWFLHRTTAFGVEAQVADGEKLFSAVLRHCPALSVLHCPTNMAGIVMLVTACHAHLCDTSTTLQSPPQTHPHSHPLAPPHSSLDVVLRALHQSVNSMTESGVLPGLFAWVPPLLAKLCLGDANSSISGDAADVQGNISGSSSVNGNITISAPQTSISSACCVRFVCSFLRHSLQQLSSMSVPSASEQHSPSLMHNMISGLRCLLVSPLVLCVTGMRGVHCLLEDNMPVVLSEATHSTHVPPAQQVGDNWKSILSLWLELREFTVAHFGAENISDNVDECEEADRSCTWINSLLGQDVSGVASVPFRTYPDDSRHTLTPCAADESVSKDLHASLSLVQAALEVSVQHRRKYHRSPLTTGLAGSAATILVSTCASLSTIDFGAGKVTGDVKEYTAPALKTIDGLIDKVLQLFPTLDAHLAELGAGQMKYCIRPATGSSNQGSSMVEVVFNSLFQSIARVHHSQQTALSSRYVKQWTLAVLSSLCAHQNAQTHRAHSGFGFRSAASTLAMGEPHRAVVRMFVSSLTSSKGNEDNVLQVVDAEMKEFISTAWRELGGADNEILSAFDHSGAAAAAAAAAAVAVAADGGTGASVAVLATGASNITEPTGSLTALPVAPGSTVGVKRSFVPTLSSPAPALAATSSEPSLFTSPPPKVPKLATNNAHTTPVAPVTYVKVALQPSDLASLAQKTSNTRQGFVPATYTGADRANLNEQSQQSQGGTSSQLISQLASQAMPPPLSPPLRTAAQNRSPNIHSEPEVIPSAPSAAVSGSLLAGAAPVYLQASQHSDSTTYVSPSPALGHTAGSVQRRQSLLAMSAPRTPASLPLLDHMQDESVVSVPASTAPTVVVQDSHNSSTSSSGSSNINTHGTESHVNRDSYGAMDVIAQSELDHNNHTLAPESHYSEVHHLDATHTVLAVSSELHQIIQQLSALPPSASTATRVLPIVQQGSRADLLGAAIRQSHKLTGMLLDLLSENPPIEEK